MALGPRFAMRGVISDELMILMKEENKKISHCLLLCIH